ALVERGDGDALPVGVVELLHHRVEGDLLRTREGVPERDVHRARERDVCLGRLLRRRCCRATRRGDDYQQRREDPCLSAQSRSLVTSTSWGLCPQPLLFPNNKFSSALE